MDETIDSMNAWTILGSIGSALGALTPLAVAWSGKRQAAAITAIPRAWVPLTEAENIELMSGHDNASIRQIAEDRGYAYDPRTNEFLKPAR